MKSLNIVKCFHTLFTSIIFETLEKTVKQHAFLNKEDALAFKLTQANSDSEDNSNEELVEIDLTDVTLQPTKLI